MERLFKCPTVPLSKRLFPMRKLGQCFCTIRRPSNHSQQASSRPYQLHSYIKEPIWLSSFCFQTGNGHNFRTPKTHYISCPTSLSILPAVSYQACNKTGTHAFALPISSLSSSPSWPSPSCGLVSLIRASQFCILRRISQKILPYRLPLQLLKFSFFHHHWLG